MLMENSDIFNIKTHTTNEKIDDSQQRMEKSKSKISDIRNECNITCQEDQDDDEFEII